MLYDMNTVLRWWVVRLGSCLDSAVGDYRVYEKMRRK